MSNQLYSKLAWLPLPPADFSQQCKQLLDQPTIVGRQLQWLANHGLDEHELNRLAKAVRRAKAAQLSLSPLMPFRLGIISNATTHFVVPALVATALRHGIDLECIEADYDQAAQTALSPDSVLNRAGCDAVLVALDYRGLPLQATPGQDQTGEDTVNAALLYLDRIREGLHEHGKAICLVQTVARPVESTFGSFDLVLPGTLRSLIEQLNHGLALRLAGSQDLLLDVAQIAETVGLADWHDPRSWNMAKLPFANAFLALYADQVCRLIAALRGKSRKCLVLDLDNTLWGGVIGDDGLDGIVLGQGDATGEAHLHVQRTALALRARGIVLAVSSKNTDEVAREPFKKHADMLLREDHIAVFQANWNDKASNIRAIAAELSLGLDAMVFLDDNPVERNLVRTMVPEVAVPELPSDPALYARTLLAAGYFEAIAFSEEDRKRAEFYQDNARRVVLQARAGNLQAYLESLQMQMTLRPFDDAGRARIAQLINKSNQFNLTTRRYTEAEVAEAQADPDTFTLQVRLADTFGDNGIISVIICRKKGGDWLLDTWLMSCRVLGRQVEVAVLQEVVAQARARGVRALIGNYLPTAKNELVRDHYQKLGFTLIAQREDGGSTWRLAIEEARSTPLPIAVQRIELDVKPYSQPVTVSAREAAFAQTPAE